MRKKARAVIQKEIQIEREKTQLVVEAPRVTHLMKSVRIDLTPSDHILPIYESVAIEPLTGSSNFVDIKIYKMNYRTNTAYKPGIVRFYFDGRPPKVIENITEVE
jgi:hypothetical protein